MYIYIIYINIYYFYLFFFFLFIIELEFRKSVLRNARIAKVLVGNEFKIIDAKKGDYVIITQQNIDNEHSYGFKINEPRKKGLFKNSNIKYLNESEKDAVLV